MIGLVQRIMDADGTEDEIDQMIEQLEANVPDPNVIGLIFSPEYPESIAADVVDKALAYKPIVCPPSGGA